ncbi:cyclase family protein [bacterium]|nr:cyclase family protein [bacterium]
MKAKIDFNNQTYTVDFAKGFDISVGVGAAHQVNAYGMPNAEITTYRSGGFVGDVNAGGSCNVRNIKFNPHGNGTHTECVGHVSKNYQTINKVLHEYMFVGNLITVEAGECIGADDLQVLDKLPPAEALVLRTLPNGADKAHFNHSGANSTYIHPQAMQFIVAKGIKHLILDLPSVDAETDPDLTAHKIFWELASGETSQKTITELVYIPNEIADGLYLINLMLPNMYCDAVPSKPILYPLR